MNNLKRRHVSLLVDILPKKDTLITKKYASRRIF